MSNTISILNEVLVARLAITRLVSLVEHELLTCPQHMSSPRFLMGFVLLNVCVFVMLCRSLFLLYLLVITLSVLHFTAPHYSFGIFWSLHCLSFTLRLLITPLVSFGHYIVCPSLYGSSLLLWYLLVITLSVLHFTAPHYSFGIFWSLHCLSFTLRLLITPLVSFGHYIVCPSLYGSSLLLWYLLVITLSVLHFTAPHYSFGIFKLCLPDSKEKPNVKCLLFFYVQLF